MTEEERRFKVLRKKEFENQIDKEDRIISEKRWLFGISAIGLLCNIISISSSLAGGNEGMAITQLICAFVNLGFGISHAKNLIKAIAKKINLTGRIEDIDAELDYFAQNETIGTNNNGAFSTFMNNNPKYEPIAFNVPTLEVPTEDNKGGSRHI